MLPPSSSPGSQGGLRQPSASDTWGRAQNLPSEPALSAWEPGNSPSSRHRLPADGTCREGSIRAPLAPPAEASGTNPSREGDRRARGSLRGRLRQGEVPSGGHTRRYYSRDCRRRRAHPRSLARPAPRGGRVRGAAAASTRQGREPRRPSTLGATGPLRPSARPRRGTARTAGCRGRHRARRTDPAGQPSPCLARLRRGSPSSGRGSPPGTGSRAPGLGARGAGQSRGDRAEPGTRLHDGGRAMRRRARASAEGVRSRRRCGRAPAQWDVNTRAGAARAGAGAVGLGGRGAGALAAHAMGGVLTAPRWLPAGVGLAKPPAPLRARPPDAASGRGRPGRLRRCHVSDAAAGGAASGLHLGDAEPRPELRRQQKLAAALVLEGEGPGRGPGVPGPGGGGAGLQRSLGPELCGVGAARGCPR